MCQDILDYLFNCSYSIRVQGMASYRILCLWVLEAEGICKTNVEVIHFRMESDENKERHEEGLEGTEEEGLTKDDIKALWGVFNQPYVWIVLVVMLLLCALAFFLGYRAGYEQCVDMCNIELAGYIKI